LTERCHEFGCRPLHSRACTSSAVASYAARDAAAARPRFAQHPGPRRQRRSGDKAPEEARLKQRPPARVETPRSLHAPKCRASSEVGGGAQEGEEERRARGPRRLATLASPRPRL